MNENWRDYSILGIDFYRFFLISKKGKKIILDLKSKSLKEVSVFPDFDSSLVLEYPEELIKDIFDIAFRSKRMSGYRLMFFSFKKSEALYFNKNMLEIGASLLWTINSKRIVFAYYYINKDNLSMVQGAGEKISVKRLV